MKIVTLPLLLLSSLALIASCTHNDDCIVEKSRHRIQHSEWLADSLSLIPIHNQIEIRWIEDLNLALRFLSEHNLDNWGDHGEIYNMPLRDSLNTFSDKLLAEPISVSESRGYKHYTSWTFWTSFVSDNVTITSEQSLFGEEPGEDISWHFRMIPTKCIILDEDCKIKYPEDSEKPEELKEYFFYGHMLTSFSDGFSPYKFELKTRPTEPCTSTILTVRIPVKEDLYLDAFDISGAFDENKITHRKRVLKGAVELRFD